MKTVNIFEECEEVLIRATVSKVNIDKGRVSYTLKDSMGREYPQKYTDTDILPLPAAEDPDKAE